MKPILESLGKWNDCVRVFLFVVFVGSLLKAHTSVKKNYRMFMDLTSKQFINDPWVIEYVIKHLPCYYFLSGRERVHLRAQLGSFKINYIRYIPDAFSGVNQSIYSTAEWHTITWTARLHIALKLNLIWCSSDHVVNIVSTVLKLLNMFSDRKWTWFYVKRPTFPLQRDAHIFVELQYYILYYTLRNWIWLLSI